MNRTIHPTRQHAIRDIASYIELRYNRRRRHSALDYQIPIDVETAYYRNTNAS